MFFRIGKNRIPVHVCLVDQHIVDAVIDPVVVPFGIGTGGGIALRTSLQKTELLLCRNGEVFETQILGRKQFKTLLRHRPGDGLCRQVKDPVSQSFPHCLNRRKNGGDRFPDAGRCLNKNLLFMLNGFINTGGEISLSFPVGEGKLKIPDRLISFLFPVIFINSPGFVAADQIFKPASYLQTGIGLFETALFLRLQVAVGHLNGDECRVFPLTDHISVAHRLRFVHQNRFLQLMDVHIDALDFIYHDL